jgi:hypothetical protein
MEEPTYYVRFRGTVSGPFDLRQLKAMRKLERLARFHEVSTDGETWVAASSIVAHFPAPTAGTGQVKRQRPEAAESVPSANSPEELAIELDSPPAAWFHAEGDQPCGPVCFEEIQLMVVQGRMAPDTLVWCEGMTIWIPFRELPGANAVPSGLPLPLAPSFEDPEFPPPTDKRRR